LAKNPHFALDNEAERGQARGKEERRMKMKMR